MITIAIPSIQHPSPSIAAPASPVAPPEATPPQTAPEPTSVQDILLPGDNIKAIAWGTDPNV